MFFLESLFAFVLGLLLGSFSSALAYRVPRKMDWVTKRSFCTACHISLGPRDLIPVFSWYLSKGKCRNCGQGISPKYPALEIMSGILCLITFLRFGIGIEFLFIISIIPILMALLMIDWEYMILPNSLVLILTIIGVLRLVYLSIFNAFPDISYALINYGSGAIIYAGITCLLGWLLTKVMKKDSLGFGDVKFFFASGLWLGTAFLPYFFILSGFLGVLSAFIWRLIKGEDVFPFGPALIMSLYILLIFIGPLKE